MPKQQEEQPFLKPYSFHGMQFEIYNHLGEAVSDCVFCSREGKFYVSLDTGKWQCKRCMEGSPNGGGNPYTFLRLLHENSETTEAEYRALCEDRGLLDPLTPEVWGCRKNPLNDEWIIPGYNADGVIVQLYRYTYERMSGKYVFLPTPCLDPEAEDRARSGLFGSCVYSPILSGDNPPDPNSPVYVCEGCFDGMCLDELLRERGEPGTVLAVPSCNTWVDSWAPLFRDRKVIFLYDNDHPLKNSKSGRLIEPAAHAGTKRAVQRLACAVGNQPTETHYLRWAPEATVGSGDEGGDGEGGDGDVSRNGDTAHGVEDFLDCYEPALPHGYDLRDHLTQAADYAERYDLWDWLKDALRPTPAAWLADIAPHVANGVPAMESLRCEDWGTLRAAWSEAFEWTDGLDRALSAMLAAVLSTETMGEPLWVLLSSPPSTGKTSLCEGLAIAKKYVHSQSELRSIYSGYKTDAEGEQDHSLVEKIRNKTLAVKDADPLLKSPQRGMILGQLRDLYDGMARSHFNNGTSRCYEFVRTTVILCGTAAMLELDAAEMGARFLTVVVMEHIEPLFERRVGMHAHLSEWDNCAVIANGKPETRGDAKVINAQRLTAGYAEYLRRNAQAVISRVARPEGLGQRICAMAEFIALVRARPSVRQAEVVERELSARLVKQLTRLARNVAAVLGKDSADEEVVRMVHRTAVDTARGRTMDIVRLLADNDEDGLEVPSVAHHMKEDEKKAGFYLSFLGKVGVADWFRMPLNSQGTMSRPRWRLSERMMSLYREVILGEAVRS